jgi:hypothetical protein
LNAGPRWSMVGMEMAWRTLSGTMLGPGSEEMPSADCH